MIWMMMMMMNLKTLMMRKAQLKSVFDNYVASELKKG